LRTRIDSFVIKRDLTKVNQSLNKTTVLADMTLCKKSSNFAAQFTNRNT
jgi:hypothetical protein